MPKINAAKVTKEQLIEQGVKNLKTFGYGHVTAETILTDEVYWAFFKSMLEDCPVPAAKELLKSKSPESPNEN